MNQPSAQYTIAFVSFLILLLLVGSTISPPTIFAGNDNSVVSTSVKGVMSATANMINTWLRAFVALLLPIVFSGLFLFLLVILFRRSSTPAVEISDLLGHGIVFGLFGLAVAVLFLLNNSAFQGLLPQFVVGATVIFQLMGHLRDDWKPPISSLPSIVGAAVGLVTFLFGILYLPNLDVMKEARAILATESKP